MALAFIFGTNLLHYDPAGVVEFYEAYPAVRESFVRASEWTGIPVESLLHQRGPYADEAEQIRMVSVGLAAAQLGIQDVLVGKGMCPDMVGGLSLGGLVASSVAGAVDRRDLMGVLAASRYDPRPDADLRPEANAACYLPLDFDPDHYYEPGREGVYLSCDFGCDAGGRIRIVMLSGYRAALEKLAAEEPEGMINIAEHGDIAVHTPLREHTRALTRDQLAPVPFADPRVTLCSGLDRRTLATAGEVREMFVDNVVRPISVVHVNDEMKRHGARLGLLVGPSPVMNALQYPFPTVVVDSPSGIPQAIAAIFEHGIRLRRS